MPCVVSLCPSLPPSLPASSAGLVCANPALYVLSYVIAEGMTHRHAHAHTYTDTDILRNYQAICFGDDLDHGIEERHE